MYITKNSISRLKIDTTGYRRQFYYLVTSELLVELIIVMWGRGTFYDFIVYLNYVPYNKIRKFIIKKLI